MYFYKKNDAFSFISNAGELVFPVVAISQAGIRKVAKWNEPWGSNARSIKYFVPSFMSYCPAIDLTAVQTVRNYIYIFSLSSLVLKIGENSWSSLRGIQGKWEPERK